MPLYRVQCDNCARDFAGPVNAMYCSNACKQQAYRKRKRGEPSTFTETEIRAVLKEIYPFTVDPDKFMDQLKENRSGRQASEY